VEQRRRRGVDGPREQHEALREDIRRETQHGVAVDARMLEVDPRSAIRADDDLQL
jgi:hypothetical protein